MSFRTHEGPSLLRAFLLFVAIVLAPVSGAQGRSDVYTDKNGLAVRGYDLVAYFTEGRAVEGSRFHEIEHGGSRYRFASAANAVAFSGDPERFLPSYGGFCAYGIAMGKKYPMHPEAWQILDGRLFFQLNRGILAAWQKDPTRNIAIADRIWPEIRNLPPVGSGD